MRKVRKLGSLDTRIGIAKLRKSFNGSVRRPQLREFQLKFPKLYAKLRKVVYGTDFPGTGCNLPCLALYHYLYCDRTNKCATCGKPTKWGVEKGNFREFCGKICMNKSADIVRRREATCKKRFGTSNPNELKSIKKKIRKAWRRKYGVDNISQNKEIQKRKEATMMKNFGASHWTQTDHWRKVGRAFDTEMMAKAKRTYKSKTGYDNPSHNPEVVAKIVLTHYERYGGNAGSQPRFQFRRKVYKDKFGQRHVVQGYEPLAIEFFERQRATKRIVTGSTKLPRYRYTCSEGKKRTYYPDLVVFTAQRRYVVEVKSDWTLLNGLELNIKKFRVATRACLRKGETFLVMLGLNGGTTWRVAQNPQTLEDLREAGFPVSRHRA